jgi:hypothetical protein
VYTRGSALSAGAAFFDFERVLNYGGVSPAQNFAGETLYRARLFL